MKKIIKLLVIIMIMMAGAELSYGQNWDSRIFGFWSQTSTFKSNVYIKNISSINLTSNQNVNVTVDNSITQFDLKALSNGSLETLMPLEIKSMYGYDAKKVFIRFYNQNNQLRVVRKIYEYDRNGKILNEAQVDSILFRRVIDKAILADIETMPTVRTVASSNPYGIIKPNIQVTTNDNSNKLPVAPSYNISNVKFQTLKVDNDKNCNNKTNVNYNNKSEFFGDIKLQIYRNTTSLNTDLGWIFSQYFSGNLGSCYTLELNTPKLSTETYRNNFQVASTDHNQTRVVFFGKLMEINPLIDGEDGCKVTPADYLFGTDRDKSSTGLFIKDLLNGENFIDLTSNKNTMRIYFTIKPN